MRRIATTAVAAVLFLASSPALADDPPSFPAGRDAVRELRLGVVCYGGVSLAIYMFGTTRELHHLALASQALECDAERTAAACGETPPGRAWETLPPSAREYYDVLVDRWRADRVRTRVAIDIISGTSAGGLNGILLAKALAHDLPLGGLRRLWFEEADIARLAGRPFPVKRAILRLLRTRRAALRGDSWLRQLYEALEEMDAPRAAGERPRLPSLVPPLQTLDLLVTATDFYGSDRLVEVGDPATILEGRHDHVFRFSFHRGATSNEQDDFATKEANAALAFAGRASASFPVAFPAIRLSEVPDALADKTLPVGDLSERLFAEQLAELDGADGAARYLAENLFLVDGGVLDNRPISIAYHRVSRRSPIREARRVFLYLEPDPRVPSPDDRTFVTRNPPNAVRMFLGGKSSIPGAEPIAGDLLEIADHNGRVARIRAIVRSDEQAALAERALPAAGTGEERTGSVARRVEAALGLGARSLADPGEQRRGADRFERSGACRGLDERAAEICAIREMRLAVERQAAGESPLVEKAYVNLRVQSVLDQLARNLAGPVCQLPEDHRGPRASLFREIVFRWAERRRLTGDDADPEAVEAFLQAYDLGYLRRNLRFVEDWLDAQYEHLGPRPDRRAEPGEATAPAYGLDRIQLDVARRALAAQIDEIGQTLRAGRLGQDPEVREAIAALGPKVCVAFDDDASPAEQAEAILAAHADAIDRVDTLLRAHLAAFQEQVRVELFEEFTRQSAGWGRPDATRAVLARYLGFPFWDRVAYPYTAFSGTGDLTRIEVFRFSPEESDSLSEKGAGKLSGEGVAHFGAFFDPAGRQRDYLWGRLDGAERILALLELPTPERAEIRAEVNRAILDEEAADGAVATENLHTLRRCVTRPGSC